MGEQAPLNNFPENVTSINKYPLDAGGTQLPSEIGATEEGMSATLANFVNKLNELTGLKFDIPYETEWEYAARGGQKSKFYTQIANYNNTIENTCNSVVIYNYNAKHHIDDGPVNELGIYGLCSNVSEACYYVGDYRNLSKNSFQSVYYGPNNIALISWRGASAYDSYNYTWYNYPYRCGHYNRDYNRSRGLRLVLRFQDNI